MAAVLRVDLGESEHLAVGQLAAQLTLYLVQVINLLLGECQSLLLVVRVQVIDKENGLRLDINSEYLLVKTLVQALQHGVVVCIGAGYRKILLYTAYALESHVLGNLNGVGAPGGNHLTARSHKETFQ